MPLYKFEHKSGKFHFRLKNPTADRLKLSYINNMLVRYPHFKFIEREFKEGLFTFRCLNCYGTDCLPAQADGDLIFCMECLSELTDQIKVFPRWRWRSTSK